jgi:tetratricopeptide (TPR) repeat protein
LGEKLEKQYASDTNLTEAQKQEHRIDRDRLFTQAEDLLLQALKISPRLVDDDGESWWGVVGGLYKRRGQTDQALDAYRQVTIVTPESSYGFGNLALLYMKKNMLKEMLTTYARVEQIAAREAGSGQGNFWGYADLIVSRFALGKVDLAMSELSTAITIAPADSPYMLEGLAETLEDLVKVLQPERVQPILHAVGILRKELDQRRSA